MHEKSQWHQTAYHIKLPLPEDPLLKVTTQIVIKAIIIIIYNKLINEPGQRTRLAPITLFYSSHYPDPS